jgi:hypothetical protein
MWHRLIDRIAPMMDEEPSHLDLVDGVGTRSEKETTEPLVVTPTAVS